jgi:hypothetical protein
MKAEKDLSILTPAEEKAILGAIAVYTQDLQKTTTSSQEVDLKNAKKIALLGILDRRYKSISELYEYIMTFKPDSLAMHGTGNSTTREIIESLRMRCREYILADAPARPAVVDAAALGNNDKIAHQNPQQFFLTRHWDEMEDYRRDLSQEIGKLEGQLREIAKNSESTSVFSAVTKRLDAARKPGIEKELALKQAKMAALNRLQSVFGYRALYTLILEIKYWDDKGVLDGRFRDILNKLEVYAYHDDVDMIKKIIIDLPYASMIPPNLDAQSREAQRQKMPSMGGVFLSLEKGYFFDMGEKAYIFKVRDDLICKVNKFHHDQCTQYIKHGIMPGTTNKNPASKCVQIGICNQLFTQVSSKKEFHDLINTELLERESLLTRVCGDFLKTTTAELLDELTKNSQFYFSFKELFAITHLLNVLKQERQTLKDGTVPVYVTEAGKDAWLTAEINKKTVKIDFLTQLLALRTMDKESAFAQHSKIMLAANSDPVALEGKRVKELLTSLEKSHGLAAVTAKPVSQAASINVLLVPAQEYKPDANPGQITESTLTSGRK